VSQLTNGRYSVPIPIVYLETSYDDIPMRRRRTNRSLRASAYGKRCVKMPQRVPELAHRSKNGTVIKADRPAVKPTGTRSQRTKAIVLAERWRQYKRTGDRQARDQLIVAYSPLVKYVAGRIIVRMPAHVELADLVSYGIGGLIKAVERFEPDRETRFESYAIVRIRGAIYDELRSLDWVPRTVRADARKINAATVELSARLRRTPTDAELAAKLAMEPAQLAASLRRVADSHMVALDKPWESTGTEGGETTLLETLADPDAIDPVASADAEELRERIAKAIARLSERAQVVLALRYRQDLSNSEIGEIFGVTDSRISQIHAEAVLQMRALLSEEVVPAQG
jgi:RNA polymerase sigma factor for flagellar operon FliA